MSVPTNQELKLASDAFTGVLALDKPLGLTSARALDAVKRAIRQQAGGRVKVKVGHAGTLDPLATGVLVVLVGRATKLSDRLMSSGKTYVADVRLGATTPSDDAETEPEPRPDAAAPTAAQVADAVTRFVGEIEQVPPAYSAIKTGGRRAYDRVRAGEQVTLEPRRVRLDGVEVTRYAYPDLRLEIDTGRGFYVRSLARDLGDALATGGYLTALRRTRVGPFAADHTVTPDQLEIDGLTAHLTPIDEVLRRLDAR